MVQIPYIEKIEFVELLLTIQKGFNTSETLKNHDETDEAFYMRIKRINQKWKFITSKRTGKRRHMLMYSVDYSQILNYIIKELLKTNEKYEFAIIDNAYLLTKLENYFKIVNKKIDDKKLKIENLKFLLDNFIVGFAMAEMKHNFKGFTDKLKHEENILARRIFSNECKHYLLTKFDNDYSFTAQAHL